MKDQILTRTSNSVEVFLSSDGQSIPFGRNWVYQIQEALNRTKLMYVFITPSSIGSQWMLFESGYAYSKGIRVVPVGLIGVDIGALSPPLSLLQGFNVTSQDGLSNIIAILNEVFETSFSGEFTKTEYDSLMEKAGLLSTGPLGPHGILVENVSIEVTERNGLKDKPDIVISEIARLLENHGYEFHGSEKAIEMSGLSLYVKSSTAPTPIVFLIAPTLMHVSVPVVNQILTWSMKSGVSGIEMHLRFSDTVDCVKERYKISALLHGTEAKAIDAKSFSLNGVVFHVSKGITFGRDRTPQEGNAYLSLTVNDKEIVLSKIVDILELLFEREVLYYNA